MALHPDAAHAVAKYAAGTKVFSPGYDIATAREQARAVTRQERKEPVAEVRDLDADGVPCRFYGPPGCESRALIIHLHGGGFVFNDVEVHDGFSRRLANRSGMAVLSIGYRRPPEHRFPAAPDDVDTVLGWLDRVGEFAGADVFVHGDSAGANLALVAALRHPGRFAAVALVYPFLDPTAGFDSYRDAVGFDVREADWYWRQYAATEADLENPDLAPLLSDNLDTLPATLVVTAEHDPLRDEGEHLAHRLGEEGVEVVAARCLGMVHGFYRHPEAFVAAEPLMRQVTGFLQQHSGS
ncbi:MAG: alpha/beta hydrolase [Nocardioides sp.]|nr:alpha/beta hydrolase [Nocardioides sp.]